jgi:hypothetical protein
MNLYAPNLPGSPEPHKADWLLENFLALQTDPQLAQPAVVAANQATAGSAGAKAPNPVQTTEPSLHAVA